MFERVQFFTVVLHRLLTCTITIHHATRVAQVCLKIVCHPRVMSRSLPHLTLTTCTSLYNLVHKFIPMLQARKIPHAKAAVEKEWEN